MNILFVHNYLATFTQIDLDILREAHAVRVRHVQRTAPVKLVQENAAIAADVKWADLVFAWFGGYHALLPFTLARLLGRRRVVVASGYDVAIMPEIDYGNMRPGARRRIGRQVFGLAERVLAVSEFTRGEAIRNAGVPPEKIRVVAHGVDTDCFRPPAPGVRREQVLTVGSVRAATLRTKGLPDFVAAAARLPGVPFLIAGPHEEEAAAQLLAAATPNVRLLGPLLRPELLAHMQASSVYVQLSAYESFGMAVAEAMLCGCVPVVSARGALPEVVGTAGMVVPYGDAAAAADAIRGVLDAGEEQRAAARRRIVDNFSLAQRRAALLCALEEVQTVKNGS